jgi:hypothetical protein
MPEYNGLTLFFFRLKPCNELVPSFIAPAVKIWEVYGKLTFIAFLINDPIKEI